MIAEILIAGASFFQPQPQQDSLGIETINGKIFVVHKVGEKETLYGISKRYGTTVEQVLQYNPDASAGLEIGQILKVPYTPKVSTSAPKGGIIHVVSAGETMFSISKAYSVSVDELKEWNGLKENALSVGQELVIKKRNTVVTTTVVEPATVSTSVPKGFHAVEQKETLFSIAAKYGITVQQLKDWNELTGTDLKIGQQLRVESPGQSTVASQQVTPSNQNTTQNNTVAVTTTTTTSTANTSGQAQTPKTDVVQPATIHISESPRGDEILESGVAELIEGTESNRKYLALHRTAPVGTILKVRNEMNNREVFVRVMGKLPDTALTEKVIIKISKSAYDRLGAIDPRFRVQVTYYK